MECAQDITVADLGLSWPTTRWRSGFLIASSEVIRREMVERRNEYLEPC